MLHKGFLGNCSQDPRDSFYGCNGPQFIERVPPPVGTNGRQNLAFPRKPGLNNLNMYARKLLKSR